MRSSSRSGVRKRVRTWGQRRGSTTSPSPLSPTIYQKEKLKKQARSARSPSLPPCSICRTIEIEKAILLPYPAGGELGGVRPRVAFMCRVWGLSYAMLHHISPAAPASKALARVCRSFCGLPGVLGRLGVLREVASRAVDDTTHTTSLWSAAAGGAIASRRRSRAPLNTLHARQSPSSRFRMASYRFPNSRPTPTTNPTTGHAARLPAVWGTGHTLLDDDAAADRRQHAGK